MKCYGGKDGARRGRRAVWIWSRYIARGVGAALVVIALWAASGGGLTQRGTAVGEAQVVAPSFSISPSEGVPGTIVIATGFGFEPDETVQVTFSGSSIATTTASSTGAFSITVVVPALGPGSYSLGGVGETSGASASSSFTLAAPYSPAAMSQMAVAGSSADD